MKLTGRQNFILQALDNNEYLGAQLILQKLKLINEKQLLPSHMTLNRDLSILLKLGLIERTGRARSVRYRISPTANMIRPIDMESYFTQSMEQRGAAQKFNFHIFEQLPTLEIFSAVEQNNLQNWEQEFQKQYIQLSPTVLKKEFERVTIELSWKSSAIEGNTYSLLETETLIKEGLPAKGKKPEETQMILNHKYALDFVRENLDQFLQIKISTIEYIHTILVQQLGISANIRKTLVGITGTIYRPLDNQFQIREALEKACHVINNSHSIYVRAFLTILLISYIQPFEDGNKRCSRIMGNAILLAHKSFPLSFRNIDETEYKKAIVLFYEQNNLTIFKKIFLSQAEFSVLNYFRAQIPSQVSK